MNQFIGDKRLIPTGLTNQLKQKERDNKLREVKTMEEKQTSQLLDLTAKMLVEQAGQKDKAEKATKQERRVLALFERHWAVKLDELAQSLADRDGQVACKDHQTLIAAYFKPMVPECLDSAAGEMVPDYVKKGHTPEAALDLARRDIKAEFPHTLDSPRCIRLFNVRKFVQANPQDLFLVPPCVLDAKPPATEQTKTLKRIQFDFALAEYERLGGDRGSIKTAAENAARQFAVHSKGDYLEVSTIQRYLGEYIKTKKEGKPKPNWPWY